jgi:hypothetical protein
MSIAAAKVRAPLMRLCAALTRCLQPEPEGVQHRLMAPASAPQRMEVRCSSNNRDHRAEGRHQRPIDSIFSDMLCLYSEQDCSSDMACSFWPSRWLPAAPIQSEQKWITFVSKR